jgi:C-terminal processing protease CtpA/Prc
VVRGAAEKKETPMKMVTFVVLAVALAIAPVVAGGPDCQKAEAAKNVAHSHKKCDMAAADCKTMMETAKKNGWLGLKIEPSENDGALLISEVVKGSPAEKAGFQAGDVLLAVNGVTYSDENESKLKALKKSLTPGTTASYNVQRDGKQQTLTATLGRMPDEVYTAWVSEHMKEHAEIASAK